MFKCALGQCRLKVCLVFMLCISEFTKYCSLLCDTSVSKDSIYCDISGKMFNSLNKFLQDFSVTTPHNNPNSLSLHSKYLNFPKILFHKSLQRGKGNGKS